MICLACETQTRSTQRESASQATLSQKALQGKQLFTEHCIACHQLEQRLVGPALKGVQQRHDTAWLIAFIQNSQKKIEAGDEKAIAIYEEYDKLVMPSFEYLTEEEIQAILTYIDEASGE